MSSPITSVQSPRPIRPTLKPLTSIPDIPVPETNFQLNQKSLRSYSVSSTSTTSSTHSRSADDLLDRLIGQETHSIIDLWSGGNVRLNGRDLTSTARDAEDLLHAMKHDERFEFVKLTFFDEEGEDWKISFRRSHITLSSPVISDTE
ncbi:uncharacterized protein L201_007617 [Kwoniella dendrophila CBS 6074]|uniref:Uncharacterized protein n=1 Tax=Kwoniella dendrophila CBS 6074 TaxID=1295534 RepID=A0AAX4K6D6_9TREE